MKFVLYDNWFNIVFYYCYCYLFGFVISGIFRAESGTATQRGKAWRGGGRMESVKMILVVDNMPFLFICTLYILCVSPPKKQQQQQHSKS